MSTIVKVDRVKKYFEINKGIFRKRVTQIKAVDGISFSIKKGETLGLVGESGSGKTTLARMILGLIKPTENTIYLDNKDIFEALGKERKEIRKKMGIIFQDPLASLNPRATIKESLKRPMLVNGINKKDMDEIIKDTISKVNLREELLDRYPHQLSGGQQQRVSVARAIVLRPEFLVLDEPTSALDVSVQAQILNLLLDLQEQYNLAYLFISHDLNVVRFISDRIAVMYLGKLMEVASGEEIFNNAKHPYTQGLILSSAVLSPRDRDRKKISFAGDPLSLIKLPKGCRLSPRCPYKKEVCVEKIPELREILPGHFVACHRAEEL